MMLLRLGFSLAFVLGMIWCAAWVVRRRTGQGAPGLAKLGRRGDSKKPTPGIEILERRSVGRHGAVAVVRVGTRCMLVGITEQQVQLLGEIDDELESASPTNSDVSLVSIDDDVDLTGDGFVDADLTIDHRVDALRQAETVQMVARRNGLRGTLGSRSPRMNLMDAMRELTVRRP
jgi:flagellar biosynthetic protein FliO